MLADEIPPDFWVRIIKISRPWQPRALFHGLVNSAEIVVRSTMRPDIGLFTLGFGAGRAQLHRGQWLDGSSPGLKFVERLCARPNRSKLTNLAVSQAPRSGLADHTSEHDDHIDRQTLRTTSQVLVIPELEPRLDDDHVGRLAVDRCVFTPQLRERRYRHGV